jgi:hypothetical protein
VSWAQLEFAGSVTCVSAQASCVAPSCHMIGPEHTHLAALFNNGIVYVKQCCVTFIELSWQPSSPSEVVVHIPNVGVLPQCNAMLWSMIHCSLGLKTTRCGLHQLVCARIHQPVVVAYCIQLPATALPRGLLAERCHSYVVSQRQMLGHSTNRHSTQGGIVVSICQLGQARWSALPTWQTHGLQTSCTPR